MMKHGAMIGLALISVMVAGCGDKGSSAPQNQVSATNTPVPEAVTTPPPAAAPASTAEPAPLAPAAVDARAVRQPDATPPTLPATLITPTAASSTKGATASGSMLKESELKERPFIDAPTVTKLAAQAKVTITERSGGWYRVESGGRQGWVRMLNVKVSEGAESLGASNELQQAASLATGRAGSGNVVSTSGLRGLDEEQLTAAKPDYAQLEKLESYGASREAANSYAQQNGLKSRSVAYLPAPK